MSLLPVEVRDLTSSIFSFLGDPGDLARCESVCRVWREAAQQVWKCRWQERLKLANLPTELLSGAQKEALYSEYRVQQLERVEEPFTYNYTMHTEMSVANGYLFRPVPSIPKLQQIDFQTQQIVNTYEMGTRYVAMNSRLGF